MHSHLCSFSLCCVLGNKWGFRNEKVSSVVVVGVCDFSAPATPVTSRPCHLLVVHVQVLELTNLGSLAHDVFYHNTRKLMTDILEVRRPVW